jgi:hypothetical protein
MQVRTRVAGLIATAVAISCAMVAAAPAQAITPTGEWARYTACPLDNPAFVEPPPLVASGYCVWAETTGGQVTIGTKPVPIVNPITLQGGFTGAGTPLNWFNASPASQTLVDPGQPVPGGLNGNPDDTSPANSVTAKTELVGPIQLSTENLLFQEGTGLQLPVKVHLINPVLGASCYIGSDSDPVVLSMTTGTTSPPPPNTPISGNFADLEFNDEFTNITIGVLDLVDNAFSAPGANGCGSGGNLDSAVGAIVGLPSAAGNNTAILNGSSALGLWNQVLASVSQVPGPFVIGDQNASIGSKVTFWGAQWSKRNSLSGGPAPSSFQGLATQAPSSLALPCGGSWTANAGGSVLPPATLPPYIAVIASSSITRSGSKISGDMPKVAIVKTDPGYSPDPSTPGTGTVVDWFGC